MSLEIYAVAMNNEQSSETLLLMLHWRDVNMRPDTNGDLGAGKWW